MADNANAQGSPNAGAGENNNPDAAAQAAAAAAAAAEAAKKTPPAGDAGKAPTPTVPEKYELKIPEGSFIKATRLDEIAAEARARGLSNEQAQELVEREHGAIHGYIENSVAESKQAWLQAAQTDKEIGGDRFNESAEMAKRAVDHFGSPAFKQALEDTGLGNHPELIRVFRRVFEAALADGKLERAAPSAGAKKSLAERLYGDSEKKE
jgi:glutamyl/glutaminyl-tRNA synthetase